MVGIVNELKDRCYELTDEVGANQDMVTVLRQTLIKANHQVEILSVIFILSVVPCVHPGTRNNVVKKRAFDAIPSVNFVTGIVID